MQCVYVLLVVAMVVKAGCHEDVNIDELLSEPEQLQAFVNCFLDKGPCDDVAASFKKDVPDTIKFACDKCTPGEKHIVNAFIVGFKKSPQAYEEFLAKYDKEGNNVAKLEAAVAGF